MEEKQIFLHKKKKIVKTVKNPFNINPFNNEMTLAGFQPVNRGGFKHNG